MGGCHTEEVFDWALTKDILVVSPTIVKNSNTIVLDLNFAGDRSFKALTTFENLDNFRSNIMGGIIIHHYQC